MGLKTEPRTSSCKPSIRFKIQKNNASIPQPIQWLQLNKTGYLLKTMVSDCIYVISTHCETSEKEPLKRFLFYFLRKIKANRKLKEELQDV